MIMHRRARWIAAALAAVVLAGGYALLVRPEPVPVVLRAVERGTVQATVANTRAGTIKACNRARLSPAMGGQIASLPVKKGDRVEKGQLLLEIWNTDRRAQVELARREAEAASAQARQACTRAEVARSEARRQATLLKKGLAAIENVERAQGEARAQAAACQAARASVEVARARLALAEANLDQTRLRAPFAGIVAEINGEVGEFVTPSPIGVATPPAVDLVDTTCLYVSAPIDEVDAPAIRTGMPARITLDAFPGRRFPGRVRRVAPYVQDREKQARTVEVEAEFADAGDSRDMLPGYSADLEVILEERTGALRVPTEAVLEGGRVLVYDANAGVLRERRIRTGLSNWEYTEVLDGLREGERVVVSLGREGVVDGARAVPEEETLPPAP